MSRARRRFVIAAAVLVLVGGYLAYTGARGSMAYYLTVGELLDGAPTLSSANLRLGGKVMPGTVEWDQVGGRLTFHVTDGSRHIPVKYAGVVPDTFKPGADVVLEGRYTGSAFVASRLFAKCPSKFETKGNG